MKKITGLVVILAVLVLGGYFGMGIVTERTVKRSVANINNVKGLHGEVESYDRGWFRSNAVVSWNAHVPERVTRDADGKTKTLAAQDYQMKMPLKVYHGPVMFTPTGVHFGLGYAHTDLQLPEQYSKQFNSMFTANSEKPVLNMSLFVNYLNNSYVTLGVPAFKLTAKEGNGQFEWKGMESTTSMSSNLNDISGEFSIEGLQLQKDKTKVNMGSFNTEYDLYRSSAGIMLGEATMDFPSFVVKNEDKKIFEIEGASFTSKNDIDDNLFSASLKVSIDKVFSNGETYGPGHLNMSLKNLDADSLARINAQAANNQNNGSMQSQQALIAVLPELPKLLSKGASFEISELQFTMPQGTIDGHVKVSLPNEDSANPFDLIKKVKGNGKVSVPVDVFNALLMESMKQQLMNKPSVQKALVQQMQGTQPDDAAQSTPDLNQLAAVQAKDRITQLTQSGLIVKQGSNYVTEFNLEGGQFTINGQPFNTRMIQFK